MKICDNCGHPNFKIDVINKKPTCSECKKVFPESIQCKPTRKNDIGGHPRQGLTSKLKTDYTTNEDL